MILAKKSNLENQVRHFKHVHVSYDSDDSALKMVQTCIPGSLYWSPTKVGSDFLFINSDLPCLYRIHFSVSFMLRSVMTCVCLHVHVCMRKHTWTGQSPEVNCLKSRSLFKKGWATLVYRLQVFLVLALCLFVFFFLGGGWSVPNQVSCQYVEIVFHLTQPSNIK